jgi:Tfp pilus assembly protein PilE
MKYKNKTGFSLIELIVVMTIIMVITVVGIVSYSGMNIKARDGRRMSDLEKIRIALEIYRQQMGGYLVGNDLADLKPGYMQEIPVDPKSDRQYYYVGTQYTYQLYAAMEDTSIYTSSRTGCGATVSCNYKVTNP